MAFLTSPILFYVNNLPTQMPPTTFDQMLKDTYRNIFALHPNAFAFILRVNRQLPTDTPNMLMSCMGLKVCATREEFFDFIEILQPYEVRIFPRNFFFDHDEPRDP